jgi:hypothetical protein
MGRQVIPVTVPMWVVLRWDSEEGVDHEVRPVLAWEMSTDPDDPLMLYPVVVGTGMQIGRSLRDELHDGLASWSVWQSEEDALERQQWMEKEGR